MKDEGEIEKEGGKKNHRLTPQKKKEILARGQFWETILTLEAILA